MDPKVLELRQVVIRKALNCTDIKTLEQMNLCGTSSSETQARIINRTKTYKGFGEEHTNVEWARLLGIPRNTLWRNMQKGLTIEQIVEIKGLQYPPE